MKNKPLSMFIITLMVLSLVGVSYAWWRETLIIEGSVTTGTFGGELSLEACGDNEVIKEVAAVECKLDDEVHPDGLTITVTNAYPFYEFYVIYDIHWYGSVPGHLYEVTFTPALPDWLKIKELVVQDATPELGIMPGVYTWADFETILTRPTQWHMCYRIWVKMTFQLYEEDDAQGNPIISPPQDDMFSFTMAFKFNQFNHP